MENGLQEYINIFFGQNDYYKLIIEGLIFTLVLTFSSAILGIIIGVILSFIRLIGDAFEDKGKFVKFNPFKIFTNIYIGFFRGTPLMVQLLIFFFIIIPNVDHVLIVCIIAFGFNSGAYVSEILRGGILSLDKGQMEAARALGLTYPQALRKIILPQAFKYSIPPLVSEMIVLLKETSVVGVIGATDLFRASENIIAATANPIPPIVVMTAIYLILTSLFTIIMKKVEKRVYAND